MSTDTPIKQLDFYGHEMAHVNVNRACAFRSAWTLAKQEGCSETHLKLLRAWMKDSAQSAVRGVRRAKIHAAASGHDHLRAARANREVLAPSNFGANTSPRHPRQTPANTSASRFDHQNHT